MDRLRVLSWSLSLSFALASCGSLPPEAAEAVLRTFPLDEQASVFASTRGELLEEDRDVGAEEVWCVQVSHLCYDCARQKLKTCISGRVVRWIQGTWVVQPVMDSVDVEAWRRRGCPEIDTVVADSPNMIP